MTLLAAQAEYERMLTQLEAERYTHSNESLEEVQRRVARERPETPHQLFMKRTHEAQAEQLRRVQSIADLVFNTERARA